MLCSTGTALLITFFALFTVLLETFKSSAACWVDFSKGPIGPFGFPLGAGRARMGGGAKGPIGPFGFPLGAGRARMGGGADEIKGSIEPLKGAGRANRGDGLYSIN